MMIAKKYPKERGLNPEEIDVVLKIIDGELDRVVVHPVLVSYDFSEIKKISKSAKNKIDAEELLAKALEKEVNEWESCVREREKFFYKPFQVYLDFFFIPAEASIQMREHFYERLHGHPYDYEKDKLKKELKIKKQK
jgi:hypothetical protein